MTADPLVIKTQLRNVSGIIVTADFHSRIDNARDLYEIIKKRRDEGYLVIDGGDFFDRDEANGISGLLWEDVLFDELFDYAVPGNHGFNRTLAARNKGPEILCSNLVTHVHTTRRVCSMVVVNVVGVRVCIFGGIGHDAFRSIPLKDRHGFHINNLYDSISAIQASVKSDCDVSLIISHSGLEQDFGMFSDGLLAQVVVSSHCHSSVGAMFDCDFRCIKPMEYGEGFIEIVPRVRCEMGDPLGLRFTSRLVKDSVENANGVLPHEVVNALSEADVKKLQIVKEWSGDDVSRDDLATRLGVYIANRYQYSVLLNATCLRSGVSRPAVTTYAIEQMEPYGNDFVLVEPIAKVAINSALIDGIDLVAYYPGNLGALPDAPFITTSFLAENYFHSARVVKSLLSVRQAIIECLNIKIP